MLFVFLFLVSAVACSSLVSDSSLSGMADESVVSPIYVVTTTNILKDWVENVGGDAVSVHSLVPGNVDPHSFRPTPRSVQFVEEADIVFLVGSEYEDTWLEKLSANVVSNPGKLVYLAESVDLRSYSRGIEGEDGKDNEINDDYVHDSHLPGSMMTDPHFWHDPIIVIDAVKRIVSDLSSIDVTKQAYFEANGNAYMEKLNDLDEWVISQVDRVPSDSRVFVTNHKTLGYFADRYNFEIIGSIIESLSSDGNVTPRGLVDILDKVTDNGVKIIFGEFHMADKIVRTISEDTGVVVALLYSENFDFFGGDVTNYIEMIEANVRTIVGGLESSYMSGSD